MVIYSLDSAFLNCERKFTPFEANAIRFPTTVVFLQHLCATVQCLIEADGAEEWEMGLNKVSDSQMGARREVQSNGQKASLTNIPSD